MSEILDLDKLIPEKREIKLEGKTINVTKVPSKVTLGMADKYEKIDKENPKSMDIVVEMVCEIMNSQNDEEVTKDWLYNNTDIRQLMQVIEFVMKPINEKLNNKDEGKNEEKAQEK